MSSKATMIKTKRSINEELESGAPAERRASDRFPIERSLAYRTIGGRRGFSAGKGVTINMSSGGIFFTAEHAFSPGQKMEVSVSWPAQLDNSCALKLVARGRVVRSDNQRIAMEIEQYEFKTAGSSM